MSQANPFFDELLLIRSIKFVTDETDEKKLTNKEKLESNVILAFLEYNKYTLMGSLIDFDQKLYKKGIEYFADRFAKVAPENVCERILLKHGIITLQTECKSHSPCWLLTELTKKIISESCGIASDSFK
jgi:hypothetical protein